ncbi:hypothetical protein [Streptomyces sp. NPDC048142]|uniref:hypothetical protein n=1 Tax=Streptomyces sp. NPDC048142 TaxID=3365501 RepID=UPI0037192A30
MSSGVRTQIAVTPQADEDSRRLDATTKNTVGDFVRRLRADRSNRALRLTFLREAGGNGRLFLTALDGSRMGLLLETEENRFSLLAVRGGPAARDELARLTVEINAVSGGVELVDQSEVSAIVVAMPDRPVSGPEPGTRPQETAVFGAPVYPHRFSGRYAGPFGRHPHSGCTAGASPRPLRRCGPSPRCEAFRLISPDRYRQEEQRARSLLFVAAPGRETNWWSPGTARRADVCHGRPTATPAVRHPCRRTTVLHRDRMRPDPGDTAARPSGADRCHGLGHQ